MDSERLGVMLSSGDSPALSGGKTSRTRRRSRVVRLSRLSRSLSLRVSLPENRVESGWSSTPPLSCFSQSLLPVHTLCDRRFMAEQ